MCYIAETSEKHFEEVKSLEEQRDSLMNKLTTLQQILDGQIDKFKQQVYIVTMEPYFLMFTV